MASEPPPICTYCGVHGCLLAAIPEAHKPKRRNWLYRLLHRKP